MKKQENQHAGIWQNVLRNASENKESTTIDEKKTVLVLGDERVGKSSLVARLQGEDVGDVRQGLTLDYSYVDVQDDFGDLAGRLNLWEIPHEEDILPFTKFALNKTNIEETIVVLTFDLSSPTNSLKSLEKWISFLEDFITKNIFSEKSFLKRKEKLVRKMRESWFKVFSGLGEGEGEGEREGEREKEEEKKGDLGEEEEEKEKRDEGVVELEEETLTRNLGIRIILAGCKSDVIDDQRHHEDVEHDYRLLHYKLRRFGLRIGAPLVYTSSLKEINTDLLLGILSNMFFGFPVRSDSEILDHVYIPYGWDSLSKITSDIPDLDEFDDFISAPKKSLAQPKILSKEQRVVLAESDEEFLLRHYKHLQSKKDGKEMEDSSPSRSLGTVKNPNLRPATHSVPTVSTLSLPSSPKRDPSPIQSTSPSPLSPSPLSPSPLSPSPLSPFAPISPARATPSPSPDDNAAVVDAAKRTELHSFFDNLMSSKK